MNEHEASSGYIKTAAHNYVSRQAIIHNPRNVEMKGKSIILPDAIVRGDFAAVRMGRYCCIGANTILRPCHSRLANKLDEVAFVPLTIGNHTRIGNSCVIEAAAIGASVFVGDGCVLSKRCIVKDCCYIDPGTVVVDDMVIPPFSIVSGCPGRIVGELPESSAVEFVNQGVDAFTQFIHDQK
mmetsp:Transcript_12036/g.18155  ORF Transcript_12036/g.18155 Transcript_12036/m.18155 type:complete len:182 (-) Transcript_12036:48-593(-)